jgi:hypothetical protein
MSQPFSIFDFFKPELLTSSKVGNSVFYDLKISFSRLSRLKTAFVHESEFSGAIAPLKLNIAFLNRFVNFEVFLDEITVSGNFAIVSLYFIIFGVFFLNFFFSDNFPKILSSRQNKCQNEKMCEIKLSHDINDHLTTFLLISFFL